MMQVSCDHGILDHTVTSNVWVYVDHSTQGTVLNFSQRLHHQASIIQDGDSLTFGNTTIFVKIYQRTIPGQSSLSMTPISQKISPTQFPTQNERIINKTLSNQRNHPVPFLDTLSLNCSSPIPHPPSFIDSPIPKSSNRRTQSNFYQQPQNQGNLTTLPNYLNSQKTNVNANSNGFQSPPLEYSSSPLNSPHGFMNSNTKNNNNFTSNQETSPIPMKSRPETLRIQVSKKMAGQHHSQKQNWLLTQPLTSPMNAMHHPKSLSISNSNGPASPVPHQVLLRQHESFKNTIKDKQQEQERLQQEQEIWLRERDQYQQPSTHQIIQTNPFHEKSHENSQNELSQPMLRKTKSGATKSNSISNSYSNILLNQSVSSSSSSTKSLPNEFQIINNNPISVNDKESEQSETLYSEDPLTYRKKRFAPLEFEMDDLLASVSSSVATEIAMLRQSTPSPKNEVEIKKSTNLTKEKQSNVMNFQNLSSPKDDTLNSKDGLSKRSMLLPSSMTSSFSGTDLFSSAMESEDPENTCPLHSSPRCLQFRLEDTEINS